MRVLLVLLFIVAANPAHARTIWYKGLFGDVFSTGIIEMANQYGEKHNCWCRQDSVTKEVIRTYRRGEGPVNIVGHSLGANAAMQTAIDLRKAGIPVGKVILLDPTVKKNMTGFKAYNFKSRDFRARDIPGSTLYYMPWLSHVPLATDAIVQSRIKRLIDGNIS